VADVIEKMDWIDDDEIDVLGAHFPDAVGRSLTSSRRQVVSRRLLE
jgi:hypothetical protein